MKPIWENLLTTRINQSNDFHLNFPRESVDKLILVAVDHYCVLTAFNFTSSGFADTIALGFMSHSTLQSDWWSF